MVVIGAAVSSSARHGWYIASGTVVQDSRSSILLQRNLVRLARICDCKTACQAEVHFWAANFFNEYPAADIIASCYCPETTVQG